MQVRPEYVDEYKARHRSVWAPMLREIAVAGRRNYSLFLRDDGLLVGYYETDSAAASTAYLRGSEIAARWESEMSRFFVGPQTRADQEAESLQQVFNLEDGLSAARVA